MNEETTGQDENNDDMSELENLIFGNCSSGNNSLCVKQMVETRVSSNNLIGDCSKKHILPIVTSNKHHDLQCITPNTVIILFVELFAIYLSLSLKFLTNSHES